MGVGVATSLVATRRSGEEGSGPHIFKPDPSPLVIKTFLHENTFEIESETCLKIHFLPCQVHTLDVVDGLPTDGTSTNPEVSPS